MHRLFCLLLVVLAQPALSRDLMGQAVVRERIALPAHAELRLELRAEGAVVAEHRQPTNGSQAPLSFILTVPASNLTLRASIFDAGQPIFLSPPIAIAAGTHAINLGEVGLQRSSAMGSVQWMICGDHIVQLSFVRGHARVRLGAETVDLPPTPSPAGDPRFEGPGAPETSVVSAKDHTQITWRGRSLPPCKSLADPALAPITARGNEPGWVVTLGADGMFFSAETGDTATVQPLPEPDPMDGGVRYASPAKDLKVTLFPGLCVDSMSGMPYPMTVRVTTPEATLDGCGGDPLALLQGEWRLMMLEGASLPKHPLVFAVDGARLSGDAGCNRLMADLTLTGEALTIAKVAMTRRACDRAAMQREVALAAALGAVDHFEIDDTGGLILNGGGRPLLRAER